MILVEEMDRTLKASVRDYGDFNPEALSGLGNPRKIKHHVPHSGTKSALDLVSVVQMAIGEKVPFGVQADTR